jgi:hypothetical protein
MTRSLWHRGGRWAFWLQEKKIKVLNFLQPVLGESKNMQNFVTSLASISTIERKGCSLWNSFDLHKKP